MGARVLIIGVGDAGQRIADGLARFGKVDQLILSDLGQGRGPALAGMLTSCYDCSVKFIELDLPENVDLQEAVDFHWRISRQDGIETVSDDGTVIFSEKAKRAIAHINPALCEPLTLKECLPRHQLLMTHLNA